MNPSPKTMDQLSKCFTKSAHIFHHKKAKVPLYISFKKLVHMFGNRENFEIRKRNSKKEKKKKKEKNP